MALRRPTARMGPGMQQYRDGHRALPALLMIVTSPARLVVPAAALA